MTLPLLLPQPAALDLIPDAPPFSPAEGLSIVTGFGAERGEWLAAQAVRTALRAHGVEAPLQPQIRCPNTLRTIVLAVRGRDEQIFPDVAQPLEWPLGDSSEAYALTVDAERIVVWGAGPAGLIQGSRTLRQLITGFQTSLPALRIADAPTMRWRGIMLDIARGKVPTLKSLCHLVDEISAYKINMLQLYTEHTLSSRRHPRIGLGSGALSAEDIKALDLYCRERHIELVPCLQSFGHMRKILELPEYRHLAESDQLWSLAPTNPAVYEFLDDLYADYLACFSSRYLNVCSDETYDLGTGQSKEAAEREGNGRLYLGHLLRLHALAAAYGRTIMVWDDIFLHYPELVGEIPKDVVLLNWEYEAQDDYPQVQGFHEAGLRQMVCPGTSSWNSLFPRLANGRKNIRNLVRAGVRVGALGTLTTDWGDSGHHNLLGCSWYGYAYGAQESWGPGRTDDDEFERRFAHLHFGPIEAGPALAAMRALTEACTLPGIIRRNGSLSMELLFSDPAADMKCAAIPDHALTRMSELAIEARTALTGLDGAGIADEEARLEACRTLAELRLSAGLVAHAAQRGLIGRRLAATVTDDQRRTLDPTLKVLKRELHALRLEFQRIWLARNRPEGIDQMLDKFDRSAQVLDGWRVRTAPVY